MQKVELFQAADGSVFQTEKECASYEEKEALNGSMERWARSQGWAPRTTDSIIFGVLAWESARDDIISGNYDFEALERAEEERLRKQEERVQKKLDKQKAVAAAA